MLETRYDHKKVEKDKYENWKNKGYFTAGDKTKTPFSMVIPPPNVTGKLHLGHAWDTTIQDIIARYKKAKGYDVLWLPGCDHAGIATQAKIMNKLKQDGVDTTKLTRQEFLDIAWKWKDEYSKNIHEQWASLGLSLDYTRERFTLDKGLNDAVKKVFVDLYEKGLIYRGEKITNWDPIQMTALSNIEVIHHDDKGQFYYFKYHLVGQDKYLEVATTRPETMFGDVCLCVNPNDKRYVDYIGKYVINPANNEQIPIIGDEYVDIKFGTGVMKCTPAHDPNDFEISKRHNLARPIIMNKDGTMNEKCGKYAGQDRFQCRQNLLEDIKNNDDLIKIENIIHSVGHSERSNAVVEPMLSKQWFVKMKPLAKLILENQKGKNKVKFVPFRFNKVLIRWMENVDDWCISRQLWWGHQIPAYYKKDSEEIYVGVNPPKDIENYVQDSDVLDTWFSSGLWPFSTLGWPNKSDDFLRYFPTDVLSTGYDIIFFWVSRMMFQSLFNLKKPPFKSVIIHGLVRDELGRKMSKSLGNGVDPNEVISNFGADALRYFLTTNSTPGQDMRYSQEKVESSYNYLNKIWNSARYILNVLPNDFKNENIDAKKLDGFEAYILNKLQITIKQVTRNMEKYDFNAASSYLYNFVYDDFCSNYLEMSKISLQIESDEYKNIIHQVLYKCLKTIILLIYPYCPFISEEIYLSLPNHKQSIMLESYPVVERKFINDEFDGCVNLLLDCIKDVRNYKSNHKLAPNCPCDLMINLRVKPFKNFKNYLKRFTFAANIEEIDASLTNKDGAIYLHSLGDMLIKVKANKEDLKILLEKNIKIEQQEILRAQNMLNNPNFIKKAPKEKIALEESKLKKHQENLLTLTNQLKNL